jgi:hypothetical protein
MNRSHEIFAVRVLGKKIYIITEPAGVTGAFRDSEGLSFDGIAGPVTQVLQRQTGSI